MKRRRLQANILHAECSSACTKERMVFNSMVPAAEEDLPGFYKRLIAQADKFCFVCSNRPDCYQDKWIRDRLILFVDKNLCEDILAVYPDPTTEEILKLYYEYQAFCGNPAWSHILSYLSLADLLVLAETHWILKTIVDSCLEKGQQINIDDDTMWKYPMDTNGELYERLQTATNVALNGINVYHLEELLPLMSNVKEMVIRNIDFSIDIDHHLLPPSVRKVSLIGNKGQFFSPNIVMSNIETLYLQGNSFIRFWGPSLLSLTMREQSATVMSYPMIESLSIDYCWNNLNYDSLKECSHLKHLKIHCGVDLRYKEEIEGLALDSVDVFYNEIPQEENLILLRLNEDCLNYLQRFLTAKDWVNLRATHPEFPPVHKSNYSEVWNVRGELTESFCKEIGASVSNLKVMHNNLWGTILPHFTKINHLSICVSDGLTLKDILPFIPGGLEKLTLCGRINEEIDMTDVVRRLNPTLKGLDIRNDYGSLPKITVKGLSGLWNITDFSANCTSVTPELVQFLQLNVGHMTHLYLHLICASEYDDELWRVVSQITSLEDLSLHYSFIHSNISTVAWNLPNLQKLSIRQNLDDSSLPTFMRSLFGSKLRSITLACPQFDIGLETFERIKHVNTVRLWCSEDDMDNPLEWSNLIPGIFVLSELTHLTLDVLEDRLLLPLINGLPNLVELLLVLSDPPFNLETIRAFRKYLKLSNRKFVLNGVRL